MNLTNRYSPVPHRRMVLGGVVGQIVGATAPVDEELALGDVVFDPVEAHVDGFSAALFDSVVGNAGGVVGSRDGAMMHMSNVMRSASESMHKGLLKHPKLWRSYSLTMQTRNTVVAANETGT